MSTKLYVGNLPDVTKEKALKDLFQSFGEVSEVAILRGYGFVHFNKSSDAETALEALDGSEFMDSRLQVQFSRTKGHGYGRGSGPPRPRGPPRGGYRDSYRRNDSGGYRDRDGGGYRDSYSRDSYSRDSYSRDSYSRDNYRDGHRDRDRKYDRDYGSSGGRYSDRDYDHYDSYYDRATKYSDYKGRSRSPGGRDYYGSRGYERDRESYRDSYRDR